MSSLREPGLGPIVGHTTDRGCRIWIRAGDTHDADSVLSSEHRTIGVAAVTKVDGTAVPKAEMDVFYFRLRREYDRTGTYFFGREGCLAGNPSVPLQPRTDYTVRAGTLTMDDPYGDDQNIGSSVLADRLPDPKVWVDDLLNLREKFSEARFRTFAAEEEGIQDDLSFLLGSCRYPGILWKVKEADRIFGPMGEEAIHGFPREDGDKLRRPVDLALMVGDQIYADLLNRKVPVGLADSFEEFQERYHSAFGSRKMRRLLRNLPTYMILDDHEIEDNWHQDRMARAESRSVFNLAIGAYRSYQWVHSPRNFGPRLYYTFKTGGYPFFVLDTRTQRYMEDVKNSLDDNHLLGRPSLGDEEPSQIERLLKWLQDCQDQHGNVPKFIVTSSVFAPSPMNARTGRKASSEEQKIKWAESSDSWPAFPDTRRQILDVITSKPVQNVVFLSGDIHCANVATLTFDGTETAKRVKAFCITSSAFYWPFWFADGEPSNFVHDSKANGQEDTFKIAGRRTMDYTAENFTQEDNFCRVDIDKPSHTITVQPFDKYGEPIHSKDWFGGKKNQLTTTLDLEPW